ncbi:hypothetical protein [Nocardia sp. NPDC059228]|uniref:hypothetical protein n=1 Tax=Nocardia sp. NPDC059228 TaxID=3346777 RepID=UPI0036CE8C47
MRSDFREQASLQARTYQAGVTENEVGESFSKVREIHGRWSSGPYAEQWRYLADAYTDFRDRPDAMDRFLDNVEHNLAQGWGGGLDEVQRRSLYQAKELTEPQRVRPRGRNQRER